MEFKQLRTFVEVVHTGSFTDAAQNLFLSQPTVSQHIRQLEEELGTRLVMRTTRKIEITAQGRQLASYAEDILSLRDRMMANFSIHQSDSAGVERGVLEGLYDIGLTGRRSEEEGLLSEAFCSDQMVLITPVSPYFLEMKEKKASIPDLLEQPIILREEGSGSLKAADRYLASEGVNEKDLHVVARINDQEAIKNMVAQGLGISFISSRAAQEFVEAKRVLKFDLPQDSAVRHFYVIQRKNDIPSTLRRDFIRFLCGCCS